MLFFILSITYVTFLMSEYQNYLCKTNYDYPFQDPTLPTETRLDNLMSLLTREEKVITTVFSRYTLIAKDGDAIFFSSRSTCYGSMERRQVCLAERRC